MRRFSPIIIAICLATVLLLLGYRFLRTPSLVDERPEHRGADVAQRAARKPQARAAFRGDAATSESVNGVLARLNDLWGIETTNRLATNPGLDIDVETLTVAEVMEETARELGVPLVGDMEAVSNGFCRNFHITPVAVYAGTDEDVISLLDDLGDASEEVREDAVDELADFEGEDMEPVVVHVLRADSSATVRAAAAAGFESTESPDTIDVLIEAFADPSDEVREHSRATLSLIGSDVVRRKLKEASRRATDPDIKELIDQILEQSLGESLSFGFADN